MPTQNRVAEAKTSERGRLKVAPVVEPAGDWGELAGLPVGDSALAAQAARLGDARFQTVQRRTLAGQIGQVQGNRHLQTVVAFLGHETRADTAPVHPVQRQALGPVRGTTLATIRISGPGVVPAESQLRVETELVPAGERPGRFTGYSERLLAWSRAWQQDTLCAIAEDREGRFHVLKTGWPLRSSGASRQITPYENPLFAHLWWVDVPGERGQGAGEGPGSWGQRADRARQWHTDWKLGRIPANFPPSCPHTPRHAGTREGLRQCLEQEFVGLLTEALGVGRDMIHVVPHRGERRPALVNFDLELEDRGEAGSPRCRRLARGRRLGRR